MDKLDNEGQLVVTRESAQDKEVLCFLTNDVDLWEDEGDCQGQVSCMSVSAIGNASNEGGADSCEGAVSCSAVTSGTPIDAYPRQPDAPLRMPPMACTSPASRPTFTR